MQERVSDAEQEVLEVLWEKAPLSALDVAKRLSHKKPWQETTVKTLLNRLLSKGAVRFEKDGRRYLYEPTFPRDDYVKAESQRLLDRLFGGHVSPLIAHLAEQSALKPEDIAELERILEELKDHEQ